MARDIVDRGRAERQTTTDYAGRYPVELLQNAHDACAEANEGAGTVWFHLTDTALLVANTGTPFDEERVGALMRYAASTKSAEKAKSKSIGYKGIGFSAVFEITDNPQIVSDHCAFQFDRQRALQQVAATLGTAVEEVPLRGYPIELRPEDLGPDAEAVATLVESGASTVIRLPLKAQLSAELVKALCRRTLRSEIMLFMPGIAKLVLGGSLGESEWSHRVSPGPVGAAIHDLAEGRKVQSWLVASTTIPLEEGHASDLDGSIWQSVSDLNVSVAIPWADEMPEAGRTTQNLHVYFPTEVAIGRSIIVHGDFFVDSSRRNLLSGQGFEALNSSIRVKSADLLATTLEELAPKAGARVLSVLAETGNASDFGHSWWDDVIHALSQRRIIMTADGDLVTPVDATYIDQADDLPKDLLRAIEDVDGRVHADLEDDRIYPILMDLGTPALSNLDIAQHLSPEAATDLSYSDWLVALEEWLDSLPRGRHAPVPTQQQVLDFLSNRTLLRVSGSSSWAKPCQLAAAVRNIPPLPPFVDIQLAERDGLSDSIAKLLGLKNIDVKSAAELLVDSLEGDPSADRSADYRAGYEYLTELWELDPGQLKSLDTKLHGIPLPARREESLESTPEWRVSSTLYFGQDWCPESIAEPLYGPFGEAEFLAILPPLDNSDRKGAIRMLRAFGVADSPRMLPIQNMLSLVAVDHEWSRSPAVRSASEHRTCSQPQVYCEKFTGLDRLRRLLADATQKQAELIAKLADECNIAGQRVKIRCQTQKCNKNSPFPRQVEGPDAFNLRTMSWLPLKSGGRASPESCWTGILESQQNLLLRETALPEPLAKRLGVSTPTKPKRVSIEYELAHLSESFPELRERGVRQTAEFLADQLGKALEREKEQAVAQWEPVFPASDGPDSVCWASSPLLGDVPGAEELAGTKIVLGTNSASLKDAYGLQMASEVVTITALPGPRADHARFDLKAKAELVAYLTAKGAEVEKTARLVGRLDEFPATSLRVRLSGLDDIEVVKDRSCYIAIETKREGSARVKRGILYRWIDHDEETLSGELARYLERQALDDTIDLFLRDSNHALRKADVGEAAIGVALETIMKYTPVDATESGPPSAASPQPPSGNPDASMREILQSDVSEGAAATGPDQLQRADELPSSAQGEAAASAADRADPRQVRGATAADATARGGDSGRVASGMGHRPSANPKTSAPELDAPRKRLVSYLRPAREGLDEYDDNEGQSEGNVDVERAGVAAVVEVEESEGRNVEVKPHNHPGFDIKSMDQSGTRYIEVKATAGPWDDLGVAMTATEFEFASEYGENYWLYVVERALTEPILHRIQNPRGQVDRFMFDGGWRDTALRAVPSRQGTVGVPQAVDRPDL